MHPDPGIRPAHCLGCQDCGSGSAPWNRHPQILTDLTVDACVAMRALADVLGEDIPSVEVVNHLAFGITVAGIWETGTWGEGGR